MAAPKSMLKNSDRKELAKFEAIVDRFTSERVGLVFALRSEQQTEESKEEQVSMDVEKLSRKERKLVNEYRRVESRRAVKAYLDSKGRGLDNEDFERAVELFYHQMTEPNGHIYPMLGSEVATGIFERKVRREVDRNVDDFVRRFLRWRFWAVIAVNFVGVFPTICLLLVTQVFTNGDFGAALLLSVMISVCIAGVSIIVCLEAELFDGQRARRKAQKLADKRLPGGAVYWQDFVDEAWKKHKRLYEMGLVLEAVEADSNVTGRLSLAEQSKEEV